MEENISEILTTKKWSIIMEVINATVSDIESDWFLMKMNDQSEAVIWIIHKFFHKCGQWGYGFDTFDKNFQ